MAENALVQSDTTLLYPSRLSCDVRRAATTRDILLGVWRRAADSKRPPSRAWPERVVACVAERTSRRVIHHNRIRTILVLTHDLLAMKLRFLERKQWTQSFRRLFAGSGSS
jgi:hypothetical protein